MRLRTHISKQTGSRVPAVEIHSHLVTAINHDAMVAHALMMAMDRLAEDARFFVFRDADALLVEWGYGED